MSALQSKFAKQKVMVPSPPPLTMQGRLLCKGGGVQDPPPSSHS